LLLVDFNARAVSGWMPNFFERSHYRAADTPATDARAKPGQAPHNRTDGNQGGEDRYEVAHTPRLPVQARSSPVGSKVPLEVDVATPKSWFARPATTIIVAI
jgi:hypothetical protein